MAFTGSGRSIEGTTYITNGGGFSLYGQTVFGGIVHSAVVHEEDEDYEERCDYCAEAKHPEGENCPFKNSSDEEDEESDVGDVEGETLGDAVHGTTLRVSLLHVSAAHGTGAVEPAGQYVPAVRIRFLMKTQ